MIRRINFFGGAGCGKSTSASLLFSKMKQDGMSVENIPEYVKKWTYYNRKPEGWDQVYLFGKQLQNEDLALRGGFKYIVCDSPLLLAIIYSNIYNFQGGEELFSLASKFELQYPSLNIFLHRGDTKYDTVGRFQTEESSKKIDTTVETYLINKNIPYTDFSYYDQDKIYQYIKGKLKEMSY